MGSRERLDAQHAGPGVYVPKHAGKETVNAEDLSELRRKIEEGGSWLHSCWMKDLDETKDDPDWYVQRVRESFIKVLSREYGMTPLSRREGGKYRVDFMKDQEQGIEI